MHFLLRVADAMHPRTLAALQVPMRTLACNAHWDATYVEDHMQTTPALIETSPA